MLTKDFNFQFPPESVAQQPPETRGQSRMMVLDRISQQIEHRHFYDFPDYFQPGDLILFNNTQVIPARIWGKKLTGGTVEILLVKEVDSDSNSWSILLRRSKGIKNGEKILLPNGFEQIEAEPECTPDGEWKLKFPDNFNVHQWMEKEGGVPLPPYIRRKEKQQSDFERYQTVFAQKKGSIAAPTAGLHFTEEVLDKLRSKGVELCSVTLHVGLGTFKPIRTEKIEEHSMHEEFYEIPKQTIDAIQKAKSEKRRITAIGTTSARAVESFFSRPVSKQIPERIESTRLFIFPGYSFQVIDRLFTNFHQPESTLIMLTSAFAGKDFLFRSYEEAVEKKYQLFSYGDCMLIL